MPESFGASSAALYADSPSSFAPVFPVVWPVPVGPVFPNYPQCPAGFGCVGHADDSMLTTHDTHWERFGPSGVIVKITDGGPAEVNTENAATRWTERHPHP